MLFSVIIPLYNKADHIVETMESVLRQTCQDFEVLVINDGSTDGGEGLAKSILDERVTVITKSNGGVSSARNLGMDLSNGEFLAFLDADDIWLENHLQTFSELIGRLGDEAMVYATAIRRSHNVSNSMGIDNSNGEPGLIADYFLENARPISLISSSSFAIKRDVALEGYRFDTRLSYGEDVEFWCRLFRRFMLAKSQRVTAIYNLGAGNRSDANAPPLHLRFHRFDFNNASPSERLYYGKLIALLLLDYTNWFSPSNLAKTISAHWLHLHLAARYFALLIAKKFNKRYRETLINRHTDTK